jgi:gamma-glutamylcyclotransferase (GGCT)/AIG2-like uncharacterized protein YtfP
VAEDPILYFAYGSNMAEERIRARAPSARKVGVATLAGHRLCFHKVSDVDGSGKCDAAATGRREDQVLGVLFSLAEGDLSVLDRFEGNGIGYRRQPVSVQEASGERVEAQTYLALKIDPSLRPFNWYKEHVLRGAQAAGLPAAYVAEIEAMPANEDPDLERHARELAIYA